MNLGEGAPPASPQPPPSVLPRSVNIRNRTQSSGMPSTRCRSPSPFHHLVRETSWSVPKPQSHCLSASALLQLLLLPPAQPFYIHQAPVSEGRGLICKSPPPTRGFAKVICSIAKSTAFLLYLKFSLSKIQST